VASSAVHAQITSSINLDVPASRSEKSSQKTAPAKSQKITTTGLGATPSEAEKQALSEAVRQAVGALLDAKTLIENEEVIEDRILTVNNGFVKSYDVVAPARKNSDGVFEIKISAVIETSIVAQALQDAGIKGEMAGQNLWAESTTKIMNVQDACQMLESKLPELIEKMVIIEYADAQGRVRDSSQPVKTIQQGESVICVWYVKLSIDKAYYFKTALPIIQKCFEAIAMCKPEKFAFANPNKRVDTEGTRSTGIYSKENFYFMEFCYKNKIGDCQLPMMLVTSASRSGDEVSGLSYSIPQNIVFFDNYEVRWDALSRSNKLNIGVSVSTANGELIARGNTPLLYNPAIVAPFFGVDHARGDDWLLCITEQVLPVFVEIPLSELKEAKKTQVALETVHLAVAAEPTGGGGVGEKLPPQGGYPNQW
jgi:hypothetical protein